MQPSLQDQLLDIYGMWHVPWWQTTAFYSFLACVAFAGVIGSIWLLIGRFKRNKKSITPWDLALKQLEKIHQQGMSPEHSKFFYESIITILREYVHNRFGLETYGKTDQELLEYLATQNLSDSLVEAISSIVQGSILVRFAQEQVVQQQMEQDFIKAVSLVKHSIPHIKK